MHYHTHDSLYYYHYPLYYYHHHTTDYGTYYTSSRDYNPRQEYHCHFHGWRWT
jgi:hypothetical protein